MADTAQLVEEPPPGHTATPSPTPPPRRIRVAEALAFIGLIAAFVAAAGPADKVRTTYSWPPSTLPEGKPSRLWYTPLLLTARIPETVSASLPCSPPRALRSAEPAVTILATAGSPERVGGLVVTRRSGRFTIAVGDNVLARVLISAGKSADRECRYQVLVKGERWSINGGPEDVELGGRLGSMPIVNGLFSELDLRSGTPPHVEVTTKTHATGVTLRQTIAWVIAALAAVMALVLVGVDRKAGASSLNVKRVAREVVRHACAADAFVVAVLIGWWVLSPAHLDDGWVMARQSGFSSSGGFSNYYDSLGTNLPNGYWLEWMQHWLTQSSTSLLVLRVPAVVFLGAIWVLCRWIFARILASSGGRDRIAVWALASTFLAGALAWGMTLRPEPATALLVTGVMACAIRFVERETTAPLALVAVLVPLAITGHHAGIVALAPLLVLAPRLLRWARIQPGPAVTIVITCIALFIGLAFLGSDVQQRSADAQVIGSYAVPDAWYDEFRRYAHLSDSGIFGAASLRRGSFALFALAVAAFVLRRQRQRLQLLDFPASTLAAGLLLLAVVPSKWPWHFGALLSFAAVAVAAETVRLRKDVESSRGRLVRALVALGAAIVAIAWAWGPRGHWTILDLQTLQWTLGFEERLTLSAMATVLPLVVLACAGLAGVLVGGREVSRRAPWRTARATALLLAVPLLLFTLGVVAADTVKTSSWTFARQNIDALRGKAGCGLANDIAIIAPRSVDPLAQVTDTTPKLVQEWVPSAPVRRVPRFGLGPTGAGSASSPWFDSPRARRIGLFVAGAPGAADSLWLEWGRFDAGRAEVVAADRVPVASPSAIAPTSPWRFVAIAPKRRELRATAVRITLRSDVAPGAAIAVTGPVTFANEPFASRLDIVDSRVLVSPFVLPYFPCAQQPKLRDGVAEVPRYLVVPNQVAWPFGDPSSPFFGLSDVHQTERLTFAGSPNATRDLAIFEIHSQLPGGKLAPPASATST
jgi:hypothetical protein